MSISRLWLATLPTSVPKRSVNQSITWGTGRISFLSPLFSISSGTYQKRPPDIPLSKGVDQNGTDNTTFDRTVGSIDLIEKPAATRVANPSKVRIEIRYGKDDRIFQLENIMVDYIKAPQFIRLTQEQIDTTEDTSQIMEFPNSICQEIINELVNIVMENASDPRLQTHPIVSQSIASPAQQQSQSKK